MLRQRTDQCGVLRNNLTTKSKKIQIVRNNILLQNITVNTLNENTLYQKMSKRKEIKHVKKIEISQKMIKKYIKFDLINKNCI